METTVTSSFFKKELKLKKKKNLHFFCWFLCLLLSCVFWTVHGPEASILHRDLYRSCWRLGQGSDLLKDMQRSRAGVCSCCRTKPVLMKAHNEDVCTRLRINTTGQLYGNPGFFYLFFSLFFLLHFSFSLKIFTPLSSHLFLFTIRLLLYVSKS